jgi:hypothetical protein
MMGWRTFHATMPPKKQRVRFHEFSLASNFNLLEHLLNLES